MRVFEGMSLNIYVNLRQKKGRFRINNNVKDIHFIFCLQTYKFGFVFQ